MILALGVINIVLILWQLLTGLHVISVSPRLHRKTGIGLVFTAALHAGMALLA